MSFTVEVSIETAEEAYAALRIREISEETRAKLLERVVEEKDIKLTEKVLKFKFCDGLQNGEAIKEKFLNVLTDSKLPRHLIKALEQNPQGKVREELLDLICRKAGTAMKAFESSAELSLEEKLRLARAALSTKSYDMNSYRAPQIILGMRGNLPADLRKDALRWVLKGHRHTLAEILERPDSYFASDAPLTPEEREPMFKTYLTSKTWCKCLVAGSMKEQCQNFSDDELRQVINAVLEKEEFNPSLYIVKNLLCDERISGLLTEEQKMFLQSHLPKVA